VEFTGTPFNALVLVFVSSTLLTVGLGTSVDALRRTVTNVPLLLGALAANLVLIPALGWGLAEALAPDGPAFIALVLVAASPGGPFGAKLAQIQRGDAVTGAALMSILAVLGSLSVPVLGAFILATSEVGGVEDLSISVGALILRVVISQIVPFSIGMVARAVSVRTADALLRPASLISTASFVGLLAWILMGGSGDALRLGPSFVLAVIALIVLAILFGTTLAPGPGHLRTAAGAVAGVRSAAPVLAVISAEFADTLGVLPAVVAVVLVELLLQLPWNLWLARRRDARALG
jgi:BASS family bile acid:Na+ symporter